MHNFKTLQATVLFALGVLLTAPAVAAQHGMPGQVAIIPADISWVDAPSIGPGAKLAVLEGDLQQASAITFRIKLPPNFKIAPHTHPVFERVTVISGTFHLGIGEQFVADQAKAYPAGGITMIPPGMPMFAFTGEQETIIQIHGTGPWGITYLHPQDDPRKQP